MEQISFSEYSRAANFGHRKLTPRACVVDSKKHLRLFLADALEDLGFVTCECGQAGDLAGLLQTEHPDLIVLSVCVDGINVGEILEVIVRKNFGGKVLVIGQPDSIMVKAVRQIGDVDAILPCRDRQRQRVVHVGVFHQDRKSVV